MKRLFAGAAILIPACTSTTVDVGSAADAGVDSAIPTGSTSRWMGNESNCPSSPPLLENPICDVREKQSCVWFVPDPTLPNQPPFYSQCTCYEKDRSTKMWYCDATGDNFRCPAAEPEWDTDCTGYIGTYCDYPPYTSCSCASGETTARWSCHDTKGGLPGAPTTFPAAVPETKRIKDLSNAEAQTWCEWYLAKDGPGHPPPFEGPITADGFVTNLGVNQSPEFFGGVCMPGELPVSYCVANLKLFPCEATVAEISDCVLTVTRRVPAVHGCGRFLEAASCDQTIFHRLENGDAGGSCGMLKVR